MAKKNLLITLSLKRHLRKTAGPILFRSLSSTIAVGGLCIGLTACVTPEPPYEDYTIARAAVRSAQEADSARFAAGTWSKAEGYYRQGEKAYREFEFGSAKRNFIQATRWAERAEDTTRLKKFESGDSFP